MHFSELLLLFFGFIIVPILSGTFINNRVLKLEGVDLLRALVNGYFLMFASFYILAIPMFLLTLPLHYLVITWSVITLIFCVLGLVMNKDRYSQIWSYFKRVKALPWFIIIVVVLILLQALLFFQYTHDDIDDAFYIGTATTAIQTDSIFQIDPYTGGPYFYYPMRYVMSPFPILVATLSQLVKIQPAILAHTFLPVFFIPLSYCIYAMIGKKLFPKDTASVILFLLFLNVINIFGGVSPYTSSAFMLFRIWQGKAILANIVLPGIFYFSMQAMSKDSKLSNWFLLFLGVLAACLVSSMGIILAPIMIGCLSLLFAIKEKYPKTILKSILVCIPFLICGIVYIVT